jgi:CheY-like chemotaxis protein
MLASHLATILVIDPNLTLHSKLRAITQAEGHRALPATSIADALAALAACHVDLLLSDGDSGSGPAGWAALTPLLAAAGTIPLVILAPDGAAPFAGYRSRGFVGLVAKRGNDDDLSTALAPFRNAASPTSDILALA